MKKLLFLVNTPYQLMVVINMAREEFRSSSCDVIISDQITNSSQLAKRVVKSKVFSNVYELNLRELSPIGNRKKLIQNIFLKRKKWLVDKKYNSFLFANLNPDVNIIWKELKRNNKNIEACMFEDGYATYSDYFGEFLHKFNTTINYRKIIEYIHHKIVYSIFYNIKCIYIYLPEQMAYSPYFEIRKLKPINYKNIDIMKIYNSIFGYSDISNEYSTPYIFFEESYISDGVNCNDLEIVGKIVEIVGKDNITIKIHPRNKLNRFKELGYKTNSNVSIPWEIISLNLEMESKTLLSIASVSVITPKSLFQKKYKGVLLMNLLNNTDFLKKNITNLYSIICEKTDDIYVPNNWQDLKRILTLDFSEK